MEGEPWRGCWHFEVTWRWELTENRLQYNWHSTVQYNTVPTPPGERWKRATSTPEGPARQTSRTRTDRGPLVACRLGVTPLAGLVLQLLTAIPPFQLHD